MSPSAAIAVAAAAAVAVLVLLGAVALLLLYLRRRPDLTADPEASSAPRLGLDPSVLRSLPVSVSASGDPTGCAVCISEVSQGEKLRILPACGHAFHLHCVDTWFRSHSTCPLCRRPVGPTCEALGVISGDGYSTDLPNLPTNVLFWGNLDRVSTGCGGSTLRDPSSGPSAGAGDDAPARTAPDAEGKSPAPAPPPVSARMRSFRRLLIRDKRVAGCSCDGDVEQGEADPTAAAGE